MIRILFIVAVYFPIAVFAQSLERAVIASSANASTSSNIYLTASVGQNITPTMTSASNMLSQGFQQPEPHFTKIKVKVLLSGPYNAATGLMHDSLRSKNLIPTQEPYSNAPYNTYVTQVASGKENLNTALLATTGANAVVDWVIVQFRKATDSTKIVASKVALLKANGNLIEPTTGSEDLQLEKLSPGTYFVSVHHRNHLGAMTAATQMLSNIAQLTDFTSSTTPLFAFTGTQANAGTLTGATRVQNGIRTLYAGNANVSSALLATYVTYNSTSISDRASLLAFTGSTGTITGYNVFDVDMNGFARFNGLNPDRLVILANTNNSLTTIVKEQIPK
jgi:hypothetical protein